MNRRISVLATIVLAVPIASLFAYQEPTPQRNASRAGNSEVTASRQLNVVLILIDDMGWRDVGFAGNKFVETPHIDRLANEGLVFSQAYSSAPNCAPTRACLLSGQYTPRHGVYTVVDERHSPGKPNHRIIAADSKESMSGDVITLAEALKSTGYSTAVFGMWNLGRGRYGPATPTGQGFDFYLNPRRIGFEKDRYWNAAGEYLTDAIFDEGIRFIEERRNMPFFLYLPTHAIHAPFEPKPDLLKKYESKAKRTGITDADPTYAAMIESVDQNVGRLMETLGELKLDGNTMVIFTSDNGGTPQYVAPLNGSKGSLYEGGIRVPACIWWSGIRRQGRVMQEPISSIDFYPTILDAAGVDRPHDHTLDGESLLPLLKDETRINRNALFWHFPCYIGRGTPCSAVRSGEYKLIEFFEDQHVELYNLRNDVGETRDIAASLPQKRDELLSLLRQWQSATVAPIPREPNPNFDPSTIRKGKNKGRNKGKGPSR